MFASNLEFTAFLSTQTLLMIIYKNTRILNSIY